MEQLVAAGAGAVVRAWDIHTLVDTQLPSLVQAVHFTFVYICQSRKKKRVYSRWHMARGSKQEMIVMYKKKYSLQSKVCWLFVSACCQYSALSFALWASCWRNCTKTLISKRYSTNNILKTTELWPKWMLISLWPLERIILFVTDLLHRLFQFVTIRMGGKYSGIQESFQQFGL